MCGKEVLSTKKVNIDGTVLLVCPDCARFGREVKESKISESSSVKKSIPKAKRSKKDIYEKMERELIPEYNKVIARARAKMGLTQSQLAAKINERKSVIASIESGHMRPEDVLIKKLEKALNIKLTEVVKDIPISSKSRNNTLTLGDFIKTKK